MGAYPLNTLCSIRGHIRSISIACTLLMPISRKKMKDSIAVQWVKFNSIFFDSIFSVQFSN